MPPSSPRLPPRPGLRIEILAYPAVQLLDVAGPLQVFATANDISSGSRPYDPVVVAREPHGVTSSAGLTLATAALSDPAATTDTLIVAGGYGVNAATAAGGLVDWLREKSKASRRTASVCSGAFLLAEAGLLDGRRVVTHWQRCAELARRHPAVRVEPDPIFIRDGAIWTSAGVTAGIDLALALVEDDLGRAMALAVARQLVVFLKRPGGQSQYSTTLALQERSGSFEHFHAWVADHLADELTTACLAQVAGMSERSFFATLSRGHRQDARPRRRDVEGGGGASALDRDAHAGEAHRDAVRFWLRRDHAPRLRTTDPNIPAVLPRWVRLCAQYRKARLPPWSLNIDSRAAHWGRNNA